MLLAGGSSISTCPTHGQLRKAHHQRRCLSSKVPSSSKRVSDFNTLEFTSPNTAPTKVCECFNLYNELVPFGKAWSWQKSIVNEKKAMIERNEDCPDTLIVLQHHPVYTLGTASSDKFLNFDLKDAPYDVYRTERGGEVTYHGPGQLVMYPIINLRNHKMDLHWYLRALEEVVIRVLAKTFSIRASRLEGLTGVWVGMLLPKLFFLLIFIMLLYNINCSYSPSCAIKVH